MKSMKSYFETKFTDLKTRNFTNEFTYNEKYVANKDLLHCLMNNNKELNDQVKDLNKILNDMVKLLQLLFKRNQSKSSVTLQNLPVKHEMNIQTDSYLDASRSKVQNKSLPSETVTIQLILW